MPRKPRIERNGFYHIINRGVAKSTIYCEKKDFEKFLQIMHEASEEYRFEVYSFCLMNNHYHLLMKINHENLSIIMQKINARYSIYFNKKYKRVGPLWQGRFKSWYVYDENYLDTLVRYIEFNPIKANIVKRIGEYKWAMSSKNVKFSMLNFELIDSVNFNKEFNEKELKKIDEFFGAKIEMRDDVIQQKKRPSIDSYFKNNTREIAIFEAIKDGYTQKEIAAYLDLSYVAISKILKTYRQKLKLFEKLKSKGLFWSYSKSMKYDEKLTIEHALKYGDFDDIKELVKLFRKRKVRKVWEESMKFDSRFIKVNLLIARVFLGLDIDVNDLRKAKNERLEKLKLLTS